LGDTTRAAQAIKGGEGKRLTYQPLSSTAASNPKFLLCKADFIDIPVT
jgi:hypothetical protein